MTGRAPNDIDIMTLLNNHLRFESMTTVLWGEPVPHNRATALPSLFVLYIQWPILKAGIRLHRVVLKQLLLFSEWSEFPGCTCPVWRFTVASLKWWFVAQRVDENFACDDAQACFTFWRSGVDPAWGGGWGGVGLGLGVCGHMTWLANQWGSLGISVDNLEGGHNDVFVPTMLCLSICPSLVASVQGICGSSAKPG